MQTYTNFTSTDLSFTNLFVATGHDFHHSLAEKICNKQISVTFPVFCLDQKMGNYKPTNVCPFKEILFKKGERNKKQLLKYGRWF